MDQSLTSVAIALCHEGVPLRAISRATKIDSSELYTLVSEARMRGQLLDVPRDDWPPGCPRDQRALKLSRIAVTNYDSIIITVQDLFDLTPMRARLLLLLVQNEHVPHARVDTEHKSFNVHICKMRRRLCEHGIKIRTIWGVGYRLTPEDRKKAMDMILAKTDD